MTNKEKLEKFYKDVASVEAYLVGILNEMLADEDFDDSPFTPYLMISSGNMDLCKQSFTLRNLLTKDETERLEEEVNAEEDDE